MPDRRAMLLVPLALHQSKQGGRAHLKMTEQGGRGHLKMTCFNGEVRGKRPIVV